MSYWFTVRAASKAALIEAARAELAKVIESQPIHAHDADAAFTAIYNVIGLVDEPAEGHVLAANCSGSVYSVDDSFKGASISVHVNPVRI